MKTYIFLITGVFIVFILYFIFDQIKTSGKQEEEIKCQNQQVIIHHEIIKENKQVQQRKSVDISIPTNDNIEWLFNNPRCQTCNN